MSNKFNSDPSQKNIDDISKIDNFSLSDVALENTNNKKGRFIDKFITYLNNINIESQNNYSISYIKSGFVKFSRYFIKRNSKRRYLLAMLLGILVSLVTVFLIQNSGLYSSGISGIFQGVARIVQAALIKGSTPSDVVNIVYNILFWGLYLVANIPLIIFAYYKISKEFTYLTIIYVVSNQVFGIIFNQIPNIDQIMVFGTSTSHGLLAIKLTDWNTFEPFILLIYAIVAGLIFSFPYTLVYIFNGSTGGSDIVSIYYAKKKNKKIGTILIIINSFCIFISTLLGSFSAQTIIDFNDITNNATGPLAISNVVQAILSPNLLFSVLMTIITGTLVNFYFPRNKFVHIKVFSANVTSLKEKLIELGYKHSIYFSNCIDAVPNKSISTLETVCMYIELPLLISHIRLVDKDSLITIKRLTDIDGEMIIYK